MTPNDSEQQQFAWPDAQNTLRCKRSSLELAKNIGFNPDIIIDIGAAAGTSGLYETWPASHYVLVDIMERYRGAMIQICSQLKSAEHQICSVSAVEGHIDYHYDPLHPHRVSFNSLRPEGWSTTKVIQKTLDQITFSSALVTRPSKAIIKIDVDGGEIDVLNGGIETLGIECIFIIEAPLCDRNIGRFTEIAMFMQSHGYEVFDIIEPIYRPSDGALWQVDLVFAPRDHAIRAQRAYS
jgi:FkbM family methyltransferase